MKKLLTILIIFSALTSSFAQENKKVHVGGYGAATAEITSIHGGPALALGGHGGIILNKKWLIGLSGTNILFNQEMGERKEKFQFNYYGLYSEYRLRATRKTSFSVGVTGALSWLEKKESESEFSRDGDFTYVIQPKAAVNIRIASFMQIQGFGSYRFTGDTNGSFISGTNHNGGTAGIGLLFGAF